MKKKLKDLTYEEALKIHNKEYPICLCCPLYETPRCIYNKDFMLEREVEVDDYPTK